MHRIACLLYKYTALKRNWKFFYSSYSSSVEGGPGLVQAGIQINLNKTRKVTFTGLKRVIFKGLDSLMSPKYVTAC